MAAHDHPRGQAETEYPLRHQELRALLTEVEKALRKCGLAVSRHRLDDTQGAAATLEPVPEADEQQVAEQRAGVREVASAMFTQAAMRLDTLSCAFGRLSEAERTGVAALLRLPEGERGLVATLLRLPEKERHELSIGLRLSETECLALADLLEPAERPAEARPTIAIIDRELEDNESLAQSAELA